MDWSIAHHALCVVSQTEICSPEELREHIKAIESEIGVGYYDGAGDEILKQIVVHLKSKLPIIPERQNEAFLNLTKEVEALLLKPEVEVRNT
jgi:hypothetical protein